ncbi:hypothetical protein [Methylococcus sp. EFPC2]|uniref:hypothetical protein n=1 Tax=Methylococcus sp. EFPC2 TaxID=2812648 RepID=UPI0019677723|nr:hypothetical protein [Methylococcus sp. EFPC2]QSA95554.1 hypothetical protein JWZ97_09830 [Methylococcus sp. EFPC2]
MSVSLSAILDRSDVPALEALNTALKGLKFKLSVDDAYVPFETSGYLPCTLNGEDGGLNIRFEAAEAYLGQHPQSRSEAGARDTLIALRSGGDPREDVCVLMIAAALAHDFGAIVHDPKKNVLLPAEKLVSQARGKFAELD